MSSLLNEFADIVGDAQVLTASSDITPYLEEQRGKYTSDALCVLRPGNTQEISQIVKCCAKNNISIVPQGGNTGLCGGAVAEKNQVLLSLSRLNQIRELDADNFTLIAEAGCILRHIQTTAVEHNRYFPLSLGAEGSCQIGGNLSTNAGGINVLRYGNARELCLGLEVVLADGSVLSDLNTLRKNNTGYDLRNIFIGAEGTLGIITAASLKLFPYPADSVTALVALPSLPNVIELFAQLREASGDRISTFELIPRIALEFTERHFPEQKDPFDTPHPWYVLTVWQHSRIDPSMRDALETALGEAFEAGRISDALIASSDTQAMSFMSLREKLVLAQKAVGGSIKHDIAVPISRIPDFIERANSIVESTLPGARPYPFGHVGDGNIHYNVSQPTDMPTDVFLDQWETLNTHIHDLVDELGGSFSAEHGIGILKTGDMLRYRRPESLRVMRHLKHALDPDNIFNPSKVLVTRPR